ncbi:MAG: chorismate synthase [Actinobacteria bacterium]|nr:chorismate synthase [Actinomycetota bacterium]
MLRLLTAGESHGRGLVALLEGLPAGVPLTLKEVDAELARRRHGYGRGGRMKIEEDRVTLLAGIRFGRTLGSPLAITIDNTEWPKHRERMDPEGSPGGDRLTRPRPGHADLVGMQKYGFDDARNVLERASARETAARVAAGAACKAFLGELGIHVLSHVVAIGSARIRATARVPRPDDLDAIDASPVRCLDPEAEAKMVGAIDQARKARDSLGGVFEVVVHGAPPGLGSHVQYDRKLDARLALALMSIQAIKGVEVGDGFAIAARPGSRAHDEIVSRAGALTRRTGRSGGIEGGMSTGEPLRVRAAMKPLSTLAQPLATVDLDTGKAAAAIKQRTDTCAVPAAGVVGESAVALVVAEAVLEKFGGDSVTETRRNLQGYLDALVRP